MFPETYYPPASGRQRGVGEAAALDVPAEFGRPVSLVRRGFSPVLWADMPEATVDEHSDLSGSEHDVRPDTHLFGQAEPKILAVAISHRVQRAAQCHLGFGVRAPVGTHVAGPRSADAGRRRLPTPSRVIAVCSVRHDLAGFCSIRQPMALVGEDTAHDSFPA